MPVATVDPIPPAGRTARWPFPSTMGRREWYLLAALLGVALGLRAWNLAAPLMWVDEAESSINALTILEHGVPIDRYLGLPLYENMLIAPWPDHPEYEFRDSSYSSKGLATYHGWLPLYAIAGSFRAAGIEPDRADPSAAPVPRHDDDAIRRRTWVARVPAVAFGVLTVAAAFFAAREMLGRDAAWAAGCAAALGATLVDISRQARYYAPAVLFAVLCCWWIWRMVRRGGWRDHVGAAVALVLLFHSHILMCFAFCVVVALVSPTLLRDRRQHVRLAVFGALCAAGMLPWLLLTGWAETAGHLPKAWGLLDPARDLWPYLRGKWIYALLACAALRAVVWLRAHRRRARRPEADPRASIAAVPRGPRTEPALLFLGACVAALFVAFVLLVPASSFFYRRINLTLLGPGLLLVSGLATVAARAVTPRRATLVAPALLLAVLAVRGRLYVPDWTARAEPMPHEVEVIDFLRRADLRPGTRIYASPNYHLTLSFYTGVPVQSVAPVRKAFLDACPDDVLVIESMPRQAHLRRETVRAVAAAHGLSLTDDEADALEWQVSAAATWAKVERHVTEVLPPPEPLPPFADELFAEQGRRTAQMLVNWERRDVGAILRGHAYDNPLEMWATFFYRFVEPASRVGARANYWDRVRNARAYLLPAHGVAFLSPGRRDATAGAAGAVTNAPLPNDVPSAGKGAGS